MASPTRQTEEVRKGAVIEGGDLPPALRAAAEILAAAPQALAYESVPGGLANRAYRLRAEGGEFLVRARSAHGVAPLLDTAAEAAIMRRAAAAGLAPEVIGYDPESGVVITRYLDRARPWTAEQARLPANIERAASHLRLLHSLTADLRPFDAPAIADRYLAAAFGKATSEQARWAQELRTLATAYIERFPPVGLCHNDLAAENILDDGELWFVDFEYATLAHPVLDLANMALMNAYHDEQRDTLVSAYYREKAPDFAPWELARAVRMVGLLAYFWALACARSAEKPEAYEHFAAQTAVALRWNET